MVIHTIGLAVDDVTRAIQLGNMDIPAGRLQRGSREFTVKTRGELRSLQELRRLALNGADFRELARQHSQLPSAADGGDIGTFQEDELAEAARAAVTSLRPGEISPVLDAGDSFMIFKLLSAGKEAAKPPYESVREEIHTLLRKQEMEARYQTWIEEIRQQAYIKIL